MTVSGNPPVSTGAAVLGETVHFRASDRCWAAAVVESGPSDTVQLYLFPLPPSFPMPSSPGTFVAHDGGTGNERWHRLDECGSAPARAPRRTRTVRKRRAD
jgi:hypothetical protein